MKERRRNVGRNFTEELVRREDQNFQVRKLSERRGNNSGELVMTEVESVETKESGKGVRNCAGKAVVR